MPDLLPEGCYVVLHIGTGPSHIEEKQNEEKGASPLVVTGGTGSSTDGQDSTLMVISRAAFFQQPEDETSLRRPCPAL